MVGDFRIIECKFGWVVEFLHGTFLSLAAVFREWPKGERVPHAKFPILNSRVIFTVHVFLRFLSAFLSLFPL